MHNFFKTPDAIDAGTADNIFEYFHWLIDNFDATTFINHTQLVLPNSTFFPDKTNNEFDMANTLCNRILEYSGLTHWPFKMVPPDQFHLEQPPLLALDCAHALILLIRKPKKKYQTIALNSCCYHIPAP